MGALKIALHIGVCCNNMDTAIAFMSSVFNEPEHKNFSPHGVRFTYDNGDLVEWVKPIENIRGIKFDFMFCETLEQNEKNNFFMNDVLRPTCISPDIKVSYSLDEFNKNRVNKFHLIR